MFEVTVPSLLRALVMAHVDFFQLCFLNFFEDIIVFLFNYASMTISVNGVLNAKLTQYTEQAFKLTTGFGLLMQS